MFNPLLKEGGPDFEVGLSLGEADPVTAFLEDVESHGDFVFLTGLVKTQAVSDGHRLVGGGMKEKGGRSGGVDLFFVGKKVEQGGVILLIAEEVFDGTFVSDGGVEREDAVTKDHEVRAGREAVDGVRGGGVAGIVMGTGGGGEMAPGGEAHDAEPGGVDAIGSGAAAGEAEGALGVVEFDRVAVALGA